MSGELTPSEAGLIAPFSMDAKPPFIPSLVVFTKERRCSDTDILWRRSRSFGENGEGRGGENLGVLDWDLAGAFPLD